MILLDMGAIADRKGQFSESENCPYILNFQLRHAQFEDFVKYFTILNKYKNHAKPCHIMGLHGLNFLKPCQAMLLADLKSQKAEYSAITGLRYKTS